MPQRPPCLNPYPPHYKTAFAWFHVLHRSTFKAPYGNPYSAVGVVPDLPLGWSEERAPYASETATDRLTVFRLLDSSKVP